MLKKPKKKINTFEKEPKKKQVRNHVIEFLFDNKQEKFTLEEISKEVLKRVRKEVGNETTILSTNDVTEIKSVLDFLKIKEFINLFDLDAETETKYQARTFPKEAKEPQEKKRADMNPQEKRAYYSSQKYLSREEYKKNKKYINKKLWEPYVDRGAIKGYTPRTWAERTESRREWLCILIAGVAFFTIFVVGIFLGPILF